MSTKPSRIINSPIINHENFKDKDEPTQKVHLDPLRNNQQPTKHRDNRMDRHRPFIRDPQLVKLKFSGPSTTFQA
jgi:hypothetical protein